MTALRARTLDDVLADLGDADSARAARVEAARLRGDSGMGAES